MKVLFIGDVVGKIGRRGVAAALPQMRAEYQPDIVIANAENSAHGSGITARTLEDLKNAGVDFFTSGNHAMSKAEAELLFNAPDPLMIRPANYPEPFPGVGFKVVPVKGQNLLVINLIGRVFMKQPATDPFAKFDEIMRHVDLSTIHGVVVDFHGEATSEKVAFGWYADGRASAVWGTHTHVGTADAIIRPKGTAYLTDVGMAGAIDSVIGDTKEPIIQAFLQGTNPRIDVPESGDVIVNAFLIDIDPTTRRAITCQRVDKTVTV